MELSFFDMWKPSRVQISIIIRRERENKCFEGNAVSIFGAGQLNHYNYAKTDKPEDASEILGMYRTPSHAYIK
jgi:hypothetical protein